MKSSLQFTKFLLILLFLPFIINAQTINIGAGTTTGQSLPIEPYFGYSYSQVIYLQSEINTFA